MKKSLLAVAAMTAFAGAAQAQSSVTVYGIMDLGYQGTTASSKDVKGVETKSTTSQFKSGSESTSRLGFKGVEDLGGGSSAFFTIEMGLNPADAALTGAASGLKTNYEATSNKSGSTIDNRQSFVGLKKNGIGQFSIGRQYTLNYALQSSTSPTNNAVMPGNVMYPVSGAANSGVDSDAAMTLRASNALILASDKFAGFSGKFMYALANKNTTDTGAVNTGNQNWNGYGLQGDYTWNKLYLGVAYQSFKTNYANGISAVSAQINAGLQPNAIAATAAGSTTIPAVNLSDKQTTVVGTYDFGILKAYAGWTGRKIQNDYTTTLTQAGAQVNRNAQQVGVRSFLTPTIEAWGTVGNGRIKATAGSSYQNFTGWQVGSNYYLSKRTNLYAIYGSQTTSSGTYSGAASNAAYAVGVAHTF